MIISTWQSYFERFHFLTLSYTEKSQYSAVIVEFVPLTECFMQKDISSNKCQQQENKFWQLCEIVWGWVGCVYLKISTDFVNIFSVTPPLIRPTNWNCVLWQYCLNLHRNCQTPNLNPTPPQVNLNCILVWYEYGFAHHPTWLMILTLFLLHATHYHLQHSLLATVATFLVSIWEGQTFARNWSILLSVC